MFLARKCCCIYFGVNQNVSLYETSYNWSSLPAFVVETPCTIFYESTYSLVPTDSPYLFEKCLSVTFFLSHLLSSFHATFNNSSDISSLASYSLFPVKASIQAPRIICSLVPNREIYLLNNFFTASLFFSTDFQWKFWPIQDCVIQTRFTSCCTLCSIPSTGLA